MVKNEHPIPSFSLADQNRLLHQEMVDCFSELVLQSKFILGEHVDLLEKEIALFADTRYGIGVANGSDALFLSLKACGVGEGDEVITTPFTFFATAGAICRVGAVPVFVDIEPMTWNIDVNRISERITAKTKAIIPVHLYGCPADMDTLMKIAESHRLRVVEDAAQALGSKFQGKMIGSFGDTSCISFFPTKNLGAFGDAGMVLTSDFAIADRLKLLRVHGARKKYCHDLLGYNSRLDELQAAILRIKLKYFSQWTERRRKLASLYTSCFQEQMEKANIQIQLPVEPKEAHHVYHQYTIQTGKRDQLQAYLQQHSIGTTVYYPIPLHLQSVFAGLGYRAGDFPETERASKQVLSLPMYPELQEEQIRRIVHHVVSFLGQ